MDEVNKTSQSAINVNHNTPILNGICGWLSPDGEFIDTTYGKHDEAAINFEIERKITPVHDKILSYRVVHGERLLELSGYIKFTCRQIGNMIVDAYVFFPQQFGYEAEITNSQINWLLENAYRMSLYQKQYVQDYLYFNCSIALFEGSV